MPHTGFYPSVGPGLPRPAASVVPTSAARPASLHSEARSSSGAASGAPRDNGGDG